MVETRPTENSTKTKTLVDTMDEKGVCGTGETGRCKTFLSLRPTSGDRDEGTSPVRVVGGRTSPHPTSSDCESTRSDLRRTRNRLPHGEVRHGDPQRRGRLGPPFTSVPVPYSSNGGGDRS